MVIIKYTLYLPSNFTGVVYVKNFKIFKNRCMSHRYYGPTKFWFDGDKSWWFNNKNYGASYKKYNQKHFLKDISKQWLL